MIISESCYLILIGRMLFKELVIESNYLISKEIIDEGLELRITDGENQLPITSMTNYNTEKNDENEVNSPIQTETETKTQMKALTSIINVNNELNCIISFQWLIICTSCIFISLISWDIVGDKEGWYDGIWVPLSGIGIIIFLWFINYYLIKFYKVSKF